MALECDIDCKALFEYKGDQSQGQIHFEKNEVIHVLEKYENGWWYGIRSNGVEGFVPANYMKEIQIPKKPPQIALPPPPPAVEDSEGTGEADLDDVAAAIPPPPAPAATGKRPPQ